MRQLAEVRAPRPPRRPRARALGLEPTAVIPPARPHGPESIKEKKKSPRLGPRKR